MNPMNIIRDPPLSLLYKCEVKINVFCVIQVDFDEKDIVVMFSKRAQEP